MNNYVTNSLHNHAFFEKTQESTRKTPAQAQQSFKNALNDALNEVNKAQHASNEMTSKLAAGDVEDLHEVMVTAEKASVTLQTTIEIRNKAQEAYREIMRMQV
ncbi:flagellar hook-basal body complex protein FliE [Alteribacillus persepolensis]|uniref:Flagellar hook-basal body complex protein FliE n=1 Tax=Alteribacillus persepolensis TaxID=568899 RepID=A0A1G7YPJ0_9BACI|nr:flagellar hook-basal body complex protein FliE [Alteribacillus persepolensis]SDG97780.1 flagellar hook-basal body complex protein FliE [Alteribacillus persepolensis]